MRRVSRSELLYNLDNQKNFEIIRAKLHGNTYKIQGNPNLILRIWVSFKNIDKKNWKLLRKSRNL